jgi:hypothetical protein
MRKATIINKNHTSDTEVTFMVYLLTSYFKNAQVLGAGGSHL